jgi:hypothetical protein
VDDQNTSEIRARSGLGYTPMSWCVDAGGRASGSQSGSHFDPAAVKALLT